jgi:translation initiation factor IF-2
VQIRRYDIIYQVTEDLRAALEGMLKPEKREADLGRALVQRLSRISRTRQSRWITPAITRQPHHRRVLPRHAQA